MSGIENDGLFMLKVVSDNKDKDFDIQYIRADDINKIEILDYRIQILHLRENKIQILYWDDEELTHSREILQAKKEYWENRNKAISCK